MPLMLRFRERLGVKVVKALKRNNDGVTHAAIDMLCALMCVSLGHPLSIFIYLKLKEYTSVMVNDKSKKMYKEVSFRNI